MGRERTAAVLLSGVAHVFTGQAPQAVTILAGEPERRRVFRWILRTRWEPQRALLRFVGAPKQRVWLLRYNAWSCSMGGVLIAACGRCSMGEGYFSFKNYK